MMESTYTFPRSTIIAGGSQNLMSNPGSNLFCVITETFFLCKMNPGSGTLPTTSGNIVVRQGTVNNSSNTVSQVPATTINQWLQLEGQTNTFAMYYRDIPLQQRVYSENTDTTIFFGSGLSNLGTRCISIAVKLRYKIFDGSSF